MVNPKLVRPFFGQTEDFPISGGSAKVRRPAALSFSYQVNSPEYLLPNKAEPQVTMYPEFSGSKSDPERTQPRLSTFGMNKGGAD